MIIQACAAVAHGHAKGIIHRDLKPSNILVDPDGRVRLIDFGVARSLHSDAAPITLQTDVGQLIGTVAYMSPEQIDADPRAIDHRVDIYSLGVILFELLAGKLPFDLSGKSISEASRTVKDGTPPKLSTISGGISRDLETIVMKAMARDRADRYPDAAALAADLDRYLNDLPITARRVNPLLHAARTWKSWARRESLGASAIIIVLSSLLAIGAATLAFRSEILQPQLAILQPPTGAVEVRSVDHSVIITADVNPASPEAVSAFLSELRQQGIQPLPDNPPLTTAAQSRAAMRSVYAATLRSLRTANPKAVVLDFVNSTDAKDPANTALLSAIDDLRAAGIPVVMLSKQWPLTPDVNPPEKFIRSKSIDAAGGRAGSSGKDAAATVYLAAQRTNGDVIPGLASAALMAYRHGSRRFSYHIDADLNAVAVSVANREDPASPSTAHDSFVPSAIQSQGEDSPDEGLLAADLVAVLLLKPPPEAEFLARTSDLKSALAPAFPPRCEGTVVFLTPGVRDSVIDLSTTRSITGSQAQVAAFEALLNGRIPRVPGETASFAITFLAATLGLGTGLLVTRRASSLPRALPLPLALATSLAILIPSWYFAPHWTGLLINALEPGLACLAATAASVLTFRLRET